ncbi:MAG: phosphocholine cytidylyltransferase family protein [Nanoarchaeota archaeon]|nr:phosphocholine cytidylyltransferase family protein [Nanoarchaeota archaeon]
MKAIVCAAGMGTRLGRYSEDKPKCMLEIGGESLLERQVRTLKKSGIDDIGVVRGYMPEKINVSSVKYYDNPNFARTNMVVSLMTAEREFSKGENLVCYGDIIYENRLIDKLKQSGADVSVLVDDDWLPYWKARLDNWESDIESLVYDSNSNIIDIGNPKCDLSDAQSRYIGLIKFSEKGAREFVRIFYENKEKCWDSDEPWLNSKSFKQAYITCMLQEMINQNVDVVAVHTERGWLEFDTEEDVNRVGEWIREGKIKQFINL